MSYKLFNVISFAAGAVIGSAVTWRLLKRKYDVDYEQRYQEEIKEAKDFYKKKQSTVTQHENVSNGPTIKDKPDIMEYAAKIKECGYAESVQEEKHTIRKEEDSMSDVPYVISEEEYDDAGYDTETLTYFADGILTNWIDDVLDDPEEWVGPDTLERFDEYAEDGDTVFVRNDNHMCDYEIQRDHRKYRDVHPESVTEE